MFYKFIDTHVKLDIAYSKDILFKKFRNEKRKGTKEILMDFLLHQYAVSKVLKLISWTDCEGNKYFSIKLPETASKKVPESYNTTVEDVKERAKAKEGAKYGDDIQTIKRAIAVLAGKLQQLENSQGRVEKKMLFGSIPLELKFNANGVRESTVLNGDCNITYIQQRTLELADEILRSAGITFEKSDS